MSPSSTEKGRGAHTPGPWKVLHLGDDLVIVGPRENCRFHGIEPRWEMCRIDNSSFWDDPIHEREDRANARLIAAAPDLLEALMMFIAEYEDTYDGAPMSMEMSNFIDAARAAIRRATGESSK